MKAKEIRALKDAINYFRFHGGNFRDFKSDVGRMLINNNINFRVSDEGDLEFDVGKAIYRNFEIVNVYVSRAHMKLKNSMSQNAALVDDDYAAFREIINNTWKQVIVERGIEKPKSN